MQTLKAKTKLYHFQTGIPKSVPTRFGTLNLHYGNHALQASQNDRYGAIQLPSCLDTNAAQVIEVEVASDGCVEKVLYRMPYSDSFDLVVAVIPYRGFVKTVWLNKKSDLHSTLDAARYTQVRRSA